MLTTQKQIQQSFYRAALQAGTARQIAEMKKHRRFKKEKSDKKPYKPGTTVLGLSAVSEAIVMDWDYIPSRRTRRRFTKLGNAPFTAYYNGEGPVRVPHIVNPHRQGKWNNG